MPVVGVDVTGCGRPPAHLWRRSLAQLLLTATMPRPFLAPMLKAFAVLPDADNVEVVDYPVTREAMSLVNVAFKLRRASWSSACLACHRPCANYPRQLDNTPVSQWLAQNYSASCATQRAGRTQCPSGASHPRASSSSWRIAPISACTSAADVLGVFVAVHHWDCWPFGSLFRTFFGSHPFATMRSLSSVLTDRLRRCGMAMCDIDVAYTVFHATTEPGDLATPHTKAWIMQALRNQDSSVRVVLATTALGVGVNCRGFNVAVCFHTPVRVLLLFSLFMCATTVYAYCPFTAACVPANPGTAGPAAGARWARRRAVLWPAVPLPESGCCCGCRARSCAVHVSLMWLPLSQDFCGIPNDSEHAFMRHYAGRAVAPVASPLDPTGASAAPRPACLQQQLAARFNFRHVACGTFFRTHAPAYDLVPPASMP